MCLVGLIFSTVVEAGSIAPGEIECPAPALAASAGEAPRGPEAPRPSALLQTKAAMNRSQAELVAYSVTGPVRRPFHGLAPQGLPPLLYNHKGIGPQLLHHVSRQVPPSPSIPLADEVPVRDEVPLDPNGTAESAAAAAASAGMRGFAAETANLTMPSPAKDDSSPGNSGKEQKRSGPEKSGDQQKRRSQEDKRAARKQKEEKEEKEESGSESPSELFIFISIALPILCLVMGTGFYKSESAGKNDDVDESDYWGAQSSVGVAR